MKPGLAFLVACALTVALGTAVAAERNGVWWGSLAEPQKLAYATGFLDGNTYAAFAVSGAIRRTIVDPATGRRNPARSEIAEEIMRMNVEAIQGEIDDVDAAALSSAATAIYSDPLNQGISIAEVFYAAVRQIRGASEADTSRFLAGRRRGNVSR